MTKIKKPEPIPDLEARLPNIEAMDSKAPDYLQQLETALDTVHSLQRELHPILTDAIAYYFRGSAQALGELGIDVKVRRTDKLPQGGYDGVNVQIKDLPTDHKTALKFEDLARDLALDNIVESRQLIRQQDILERVERDINDKLFDYTEMSQVGTNYRKPKTAVVFIVHDNKVYLMHLLATDNEVIGSMIEEYPLANAADIIKRTSDVKADKPSYARRSLAQTFIDIAPKRTAIYFVTHPSTKVELGLLVGYAVVNFGEKALKKPAA